MNRQTDFTKITPIRMSEEGKLHNYEFSDSLANAIETAMLLGLPLFLTSEPGTGKTQSARKLAKILDTPLFEFHTKSTSTFQDLLYQYDMMQHYAEVNIHSKSESISSEEKNKIAQKTISSYINEGPFYKAIVYQNQLQKEDDKPCVILIDEIDKAPRDFPNDLLNEIEKYSFEIRETKEVVTLTHTRKPVIIITSNSEKSMPDAFMRRCIFHHIDFDDAILDRMIGLYGDNAQPVFEEAKQLFMKIRKKNLNKKPATAEFINWLIYLGQKKPDQITKESLSVILKNNVDIDACKDLFDVKAKTGVNDHIQTANASGEKKETE